MRKFYFVMVLLISNYFVFGQCISPFIQSVAGTHNDWVLPGTALNIPQAMGAAGQFKVVCHMTDGSSPTWPDAPNAWFASGNVTFENNGSVGRAFGENFSICAPGEWGWNNATSMTQTGNQWCYTIATPGTYAWKPTRCGSWDSWEPSGQRSVGSANWSVTTTIPNEQVCVTYDPSTGEVGMQVVLPVRFSQFFGKREASANQLYWSTASETNNEYFDVQYSIDGRNFISLGQVKGYGNSNTERSYHFRHEKSGDAISYYRLKQVDFDGRFEYSEIISVRSEKDSFAVNKAISPNPVTNYLFLNGIAEQADYMVVDYSGRQLMSGSVFSGQGLDVSSLKAGFYILIVNEGYERFAFKWNKQ